MSESKDDIELRPRETRDLCQEQGIVFHRIITETIPRIEGEIKDLQGRYQTLNETMAGLVISSSEVSTRLKSIDDKLTPLVDFRSKYMSFMAKTGPILIIVILLYTGSEGIGLLKLLAKGLS